MQNDAELRRHAIQIVAQLPENQNEALTVLNFCRELIQGFLAGYPQEAAQRGPVLAFSSASALSAASASSNSRAMDTVSPPVLPR